VDREDGMRQVIPLALMAAVALTVGATAEAQPWPANPVKIVVPFGPGGPADIYARILAQALTDDLKQQFIVDDKPGAGGIIGTEIVAKSPPDGYAFLMMSNTQATNETLLARKPYVLMRDLVAVAPVNSSDLVLVVHPSVTATTVPELIAFAKANPGQLTYASSGPGTPYHMAGELFKAMSGTDILHVPHRSSGEARADVMGGHVQMMFDAVTAMKGDVEAGEARALATTGLERSVVLPDLPTVNEAGVPGYEATIWLGLMAPAGTPKPIVDRMNEEVVKIIARPEVRAAWARQGAVPMTMTPATFDSLLRGEIQKWAKVVEVSGAKIQ
jgi:tripartite-type tricarboxylate transporter receptor subunit TctC